MKAIHPANALRMPIRICLTGTATITLCFLLCLQASAKFIFQGGDSSNTTVAEKKVDYLEQIYFSGGNKEELNVSILTTIQELDGKSATLSVAKQYAFLAAIKAKTNKVKNSCDVEEMIAAGIYDIDAKEAVQQGIPKPSSKASVNAQGALNAINQISTSATQAAWSGWYLSNGSISGFGTAGKIAGAAGKFNAAAGVLNGAGKVFGAVKDFLHQDKPCKNVAAKTIELGQHLAPPAPDVVKNSATTPSSNINTTAPVIAAPAPQAEAPVAKKITEAKITIKAVSQTQLKSIISAISKIPGVTAADNDSFDKNTAIVIVACGMKAAELADKIVEACKPLKLTIDNYSNSSNTADLILKP